MTSLMEKVKAIRIYWNVDTQFDFMRKEGKLNVENAVTIEPNLERITKFARENGFPIVNTADWHDENTEEITTGDIGRLATGESKNVEEKIRKSIVKTKTFILKPISPEEAVIQMELLGHDFFVFINSETDRTAVVYKRKDSNYGLIEPTV